MNADTTRKVNEILSKGYYQKGTTLGEGGWQALWNTISNWKTYELLDVYEGYMDTIRAKDDEAAITAFDSLYRLDSFPYEIREVKTEYRRVKAEVKDEY